MRTILAIISLLAACGGREIVYYGDIINEGDVVNNTTYTSTTVIVQETHTSTVIVIRETDTDTMDSRVAEIEFIPFSMRFIAGWSGSLGVFRVKAYAETPTLTSVNITTLLGSTNMLFRNMSVEVEGMRVSDIAQPNVTTSVDIPFDYTVATDNIAYLYLMASIPQSAIPGEYHLQISLSGQYGDGRGSFTLVQFMNIEVVQVVPEDPCSRQTGRPDGYVFTWARTAGNTLIVNGLFDANIIGVQACPGVTIMFDGFDLSVSSDPTNVEGLLSAPNDTPRFQSFELREEPSMIGQMHLGPSEFNSATITDDFGEVNLSQPQIPAVVLDDTHPLITMRIRASVAGLHSGLDERFTISVSNVGAFTVKNGTGVPSNIEMVGDLSQEIRLFP